jgi:transposase
MLIKGISKAVISGKKQIVMNKFTNKKHFIGVDISNLKLDLSLLKDGSTQGFFDKKVSNDFTGFGFVTEWLAKQNVSPTDSLFCMEHTGVYGLLFIAWLSQMGFDFCVEPALKIKNSMGITRGKTDKVDARRIAIYAYEKKARLEQYNLPSDLLLQIKQLLTYRDQLVRISTSLKNSIKSHKKYEKVSGLNSVSAEIEEQIIELDRRIKQVEKQVEELIKSDEDLHKNYKLTRSVIGVAFVIAAHMLVATNNFTSFENGRQFACHAGIAPFAHESGSSIKGKTKISNIADKKIKAILSNGANSAANWDPVLKEYYQRKAAEGKEHKLIINNIKCKLVNRMFAVIKRQSEYVNIYEQKFL